MLKEITHGQDGAQATGSSSETANRLAGMVERAVDAFVSPRLPEFPQGLAGLVGPDLERRFRRQLPTVLAMLLRAELEVLCAQSKGRVGGDPAPAEAAPAALQLVDDRAVERRIAYGNVVRKIDVQNDRGLWMLNARLAHVLGLSAIEDDQSPFRPLLFVEAIGRAWQTVEADGEHEMTVVRTYGRELIARITSVYPRLNDWLDERKIAVEIAARFVVQRSRAQNARGREDAPPAQDPGPDRDRGGPGAPAGRKISGSAELQAALTAYFGDALPSGVPAQGSAIGTLTQDQGASTGPGSLLMSLPGILGACAGVAESARVESRERMLSERPELASAFEEASRVGFDLSTDLQRLRIEIESHPVAPQEKRTVELLADLFSSLYADQNLPVAVKARIGELQLAVLRSTLHDHRLLFDEAHPLRRLIDSLVAAGEGLQPSDGADDPLVRKITEIVEKARDAAGDAPELFVELDAQLREFVAKEAAAADERASQATPVQGTELQAADARLAADAVVEDRLDSARIPAFMTAMIRSHWSEVMAIAHLRRENEPQAWRDAEKLLDQLLWSVTPKRSAGDRAGLIKILPGLLKSLRAAFDGIMWRDATRDAFFGELASLHASMVGGRFEPAPDAAPESESREINAEAARQADHQRSADLSPLQRGLLFEMSLPEQSAGRYRLSWVSPMRTRFVFTNREGHEACTFSAAELVKMFGQRHIRLIDRDSAFERALIAALKAASRRIRGASAG